MQYFVFLRPPTLLNYKYIRNFRHLYKHFVKIQIVIHWIGYQLFEQPDPDGYVLKD